MRQDDAAFKNHFSLSMSKSFLAFILILASQKESGSRCAIDQFLLSAAIYAQQIIDTDASIKAELYARYFIRKPHVAIFTELPIPKTTVIHNGVSYTSMDSLTMESKLRVVIKVRNRFIELFHLL